MVMIRMMVIMMLNMMITIRLTMILMIIKLMEIMMIWIWTRITVIETIAIWYTTIHAQYFLNFSEGKLWRMVGCNLKESTR